jgi:hypothetical protein
MWIRWIRIRIRIRNTAFNNIKAKQDKNIKNIMNPILGLTVERPDSVEMSAWGVASLAGIQVNSFSI